MEQRNYSLSIFLFPSTNIQRNGAINRPTHSHGTNCKLAQVWDKKKKSALIVLDNPRLTSPEVMLSISHARTFGPACLLADVRISVTY